MLEKKDVKIGDRIRFINDESLYEDAPFIIKPILSKIYTVRAYSYKGFYLEEIINELVNWIDPVSNNIDSIDEPGFGAWRFEKLKTHPVIGYQIEKDLEPYFRKQKDKIPTLEPMTKQRGSNSKFFYL
jgi:hypothetical protein